MHKKIYLSLIVVALIGIVLFLVGCTNNKDIPKTESTYSANESENTKTKSVDNQVDNNNADTITDQGTAFTIEEVSQHASKSNCWMIINGNVYNVTEYILSGQHKPVIIDGCGIDATSLFDEVKKHTGTKAQNLLKKYYIGVLK
jgi:cytochrome b involved in lipid metabolism